jgi:hypothetical protein
MGKKVSSRKPTYAKKRKPSYNKSKKKRTLKIVHWHEETSQALGCLEQSRHYN